MIAPQRAEALSSILDACNRQEVTPVLIGRDVAWEPKGSYLGGQRLTVYGLTGSYDLDIPLPGDYQMENAATAVAAIEAISRAQGFAVSPDAVAAGFEGYRGPAAWSCWPASRW